MAFFALRKIRFRTKEVEDFDRENANSNPIHSSIALRNIWNGSTPVLLSATYGMDLQDVDVTMVLRYLLMREGNRRLILKRPSNGPQYWHNYLFGDPALKKRKHLILTVRLDDGTVKTKIV